MDFSKPPEVGSHKDGQCFLCSSLGFGNGRIFWPYYYEIIFCRLHHETYKSILARRIWWGNDERRTVEGIRIEITGLIYGLHWSSKIKNSLEKPK